jgi:hypothetical protein
MAGGEGNWAQWRRGKPWGYIMEMYHGISWDIMGYIYISIIGI